MEGTGMEEGMRKGVIKRGRKGRKDDGDRVRKKYDGIMVY